MNDILIQRHGIFSFKKTSIVLLTSDKMIKKTYK